MTEEDGHSYVQSTSRRVSGHSSEPAIHVICLGSGGGPSEDNVCGFLVRSTAAKWSKNSVLAVDAGSHLAAITRILEKDFPLVSQAPRKEPPRSHGGVGNGDDQDNSNGIGHGDGSAGNAEFPSPGTAPLSDDDSGVDTPLSEVAPAPILKTLTTGAFAGLPFPHESARANALHVVREHVSTYLITHPHLDHVSAFVINTAAFHNTSRPKRLAALPFTVSAIKTHIFNNVVWPNLTDEDGGVGLVTFQRLQEGGNIALGEGKGRGYIEVCDGLGVRGFKVSHGHCMKGPGHVHRGSNANMPETPGIHRVLTHQSDHATGEGQEQRSLSFPLPIQSTPGTPLISGAAVDVTRGSTRSDACVIDSTAFFIRTESTATTPTKEILIFGDVEPDSISLSPRTALVWAEAAPKISAGTLAAIFIECSYTDVQGDAVLYGHLAPRHLLGELQNLADMVKEARREHEREKEEARKGRKRKRASAGFLSGLNSHVDGSRKLSRSRALPDTTKEALEDDTVMDYLSATDHNSRSSTAINTASQTPNLLPTNPTSASSTTTAAAAIPASLFPLTLHPSHSSTQTSFDQLNTPNSDPSPNPNHKRPSHLPPATFDATPLKGLRIVVMHVKDTLTDGPPVGERILAELKAGERNMAAVGRGLGCGFEVARSGEGYWF